MARNTDKSNYSLQGEKQPIGLLPPAPKHRKKVIDMTEYQDDDFEDSDAFWSYMDRKYGKGNAEPTIEAQPEPAMESTVRGKTSTGTGYTETYDPKTGKWNRVYDWERSSPNYDPDWWKKGSYAQGYTSNYKFEPYVPKPRTSESHPIDVDFFTYAELPLKGRLGMTYAPGKKQTKGMMGDHDRDLEKDLDRLVGHYKMNHLVTLNETRELEALKIPNLRKRARAKGAGTIWYPFEDMTAPPNMDHAIELVDMILDRLEQGETVIIHCKGGLGRTGTIAACVLIEMGYSPSEAIKTVRKVRPFTIQEKCQENFIYRYWWINF